MHLHLIATRPTRERSAHGTTLSVAFHGLLVATLVVASAQRDTEVFSDPGERIIPISPFREPQPEPPKQVEPQPPETPPTPPTPDPEPTTAPTTPVETPTEIPTTMPDPGPPTVSPPSTPVVIGDPNGTGDPNIPVNSGLPTGVMTDFDVDEPAALLPRSPLPRYPDALKSQRVRGGVRVRFVVGTNGRVEMESVEVVEAAHPLFAEAVRSMLPRMRFRPARAGGRAVRQIVEFPINFTLTDR